jgi:chromate transporter
VAQINMLREELVNEQQWISPEKFKRVLAVYQALPGPEAHELCVYFGMIRKGRMGGFLAGIGFMLPGFFLMLLLSWLYTRYGANSLLPLFVGIPPAVCALILRATHRIGSHALEGRALMITGLTAFLLTLMNIHFVVVLGICAVWNTLYQQKKIYPAIFLSLGAVMAALCIGVMMPSTTAIPQVPFTGGFLIEGLKAGLLSFGGAYTAIPFLQQSMVGIYPHVTLQSFLDGIALGNIIPAPLVIFGTYLGFIAGGLPGALLMTFGIFLPAFSFTLIGHKVLERLIEHPTLHSALDGISAGVVGILAITALQLMLHSITDIPNAILLVLALIAVYLIKSRWTVPLVIVGSGILGYCVG